MKLYWSRGNAKLDKLEKLTGRRVYSLSQLSGHTCPFAKECHAQAVEQPSGGRKLLRGAHSRFTCFSASQEIIFTPVYKTRKGNGELIRLAGEPNGVIKAGLALLESIPLDAGIIRIHVGGDFKTQSYFDSWLYAAKHRLDLQFYAYTKSLPFWLKRRSQLEGLHNFALTASYGGYKDDLIEKHKLRFAKVIFSEAEAEAEGLPIDHDDSHALNPVGNFALLLHGKQAKGSEAAAALKTLNGKGSYSKLSAGRKAVA